MIACSVYHERTKLTSLNGTGMSRVQYFSELVRVIIKLPDRARKVAPALTTLADLSLALQENCDNCGGLPRENPLSEHFDPVFAESTNCRAGNLNCTEVSFLVNPFPGKEQRNFIYKL